MRHSLATILLLIGCADPEPNPGHPSGPSGDPDLERARAALSGPRTLRVRFRGEWPNAVSQMPRTVAGAIFLGEGQKAKISMTVTTAFGKSTAYEAICDGTKLWRSPAVEARKFDPGPSGLRVELLYALSWHGLGWAFPHGTHPSTIGEGYVVLDLVPERLDRSPSWIESTDGGVSTVSHSCPNVDYRVRLTIDSATKRLRRRELIGDKGKVWYTESYQVDPDLAIPEGEFRITP